VTVYEGDLIGSGLKVGICVSRFNELLSTRLLSGALDALTRHDVSEDDVDIAWVPGAFELPLIAQKWQLLGIMMSCLPWRCYPRRHTTL